jgi:anaerobic magnesium-protoporphyrin IX monomethyl ester cyclase
LASATPPLALAAQDIGGRVLFVVPDNFQDDNVFPLGPGYLAGVLRNAKVHVETYCMDVFHYTEDQLEDFLRSNEYDLVCVSFMAPRFKRGVESMLRVVRRAINKDAWMVLGGYGPSSVPEYMLEKTGADVVAIGEGEETILEIMMAKRGMGITLDQIQSIAYWGSDGKPVLTPRRQTIRYLNELPYPAWDLFPMEQYTSCLRFAGMAPNERAFPIISTRGCTDKCTFCFRLDKGIRIRGPEAVVAEMKHLYDHFGVTYFYFCDELAIVSRKQIFQLVDAIKANLPPIKFRMDCRVSLFDDEIASALKDAGAVFLNIGFESSSQVVLDQMNKRATVEQNVAAAEMARKHGIGIGINMIWGMPGDTLDSLRQNAEFIKRFNMYDQIRTIRPVSPYPGSPLYFQAMRAGKLTGPDDFFEKFKNSDLYMVNFIGVPEQDIYETLYEVNRDLVYDHFRHTSGDMNAAEALAQRFYDLYFNGVTGFSGPRTLTSNEHVRRPDAGITMGVWEGMQLSGM